MKSGYSGPLKPDLLCFSSWTSRLSLSYKATVDLGGLRTHETSTCFSLGDAGSSARPRRSNVSIFAAWRVLITPPVRVHIHTCVCVNITSVFARLCVCVFVGVLACTF